MSGTLHGLTTHLNKFMNTMWDKSTAVLNHFFLVPKLEYFKLYYSDTTSINHFVHLGFLYSENETSIPTSFSQISEYTRESDPFKVCGTPANL